MTNNLPEVFFDEGLFLLTINGGDLDAALEVCSRLIDATRLSGWTLAQALWMIQANWDKFGIEESFKNVMAIRLDLHAHTVERYVRIYDMMKNGSIPAEIVPTLQMKSLQSLFPVANAVAQGYELEEDDWKKISEAPTEGEVRQIIREDVKGAEPRSNALWLKIDDLGNIQAWKGDFSYFVGYLDIDSDEVPVRQAVERIIKNSGIIKTE